MIGKRWVLLGLWTGIVGCSSDGGGSGGSSGASGGGVSGSGASGGASGSSTAGSAGSAGSSAGTAGSAGATSAGTGLGSIGTGPVACSGVTGEACPVGNVCCEPTVGAVDSCASSYATCTNGLPLGCDDPSDCPGQKCCARKPDGPGTATHNGSGCKATCDPVTDRIICATTTDCDGTGDCMQSGSSFKACF